MDESDVRAIVRLLGDPRLLDHDGAARKRLLLANLCALVEGDAWSFSLRSRHGAAVLEEMSGSMPGGGAGRVNRGEADPSGRHFTARQICEKLSTCVSLTRLPGRQPFSARERKIAQVVLTETTWLHERMPACVTPMAGLSPRQRATLVHVIEGLSRRSIAERLRISTHTINDYIKVIYRHYGVNSRAMLTRRLVSIGGERG